MLEREARWFGAAIEQMDAEELSPILNIGSHTADYRSEVQPWIEEHLFTPLRRRGVEVLHSDVREAPGVDVVGDLTDPGFVAQLRQRRFRTVACCNLLEHVPNPRATATLVRDLVEPGGYLLVSVPRRFPFHPDPIDTMLRPSVAELTALFDHTTLLAGTEVRCGSFARYLFSRVTRNPRRVARDLCRKRRVDARMPQPESAPASRSAIRTLAPWMFRQFVVTCCVLRTDP